MSSLLAATVPDQPANPVLPRDALDAAGNAGRANEIDAARAAGRAAVHEVSSEHDTEAEKNGTEQAVRAAVLAVGVIDLITKTDYLTLVTPWQQTLGTTLVEHVK